MLLPTKGKQSGFRLPQLYILQIMEICIPNGEVKAKRNLPWINKKTPFSAFPNVLAKQSDLAKSKSSDKAKLCKFSGKANVFLQSAFEQR